jgi:hypothetical protein
MTDISLYVAIVTAVTSVVSVSVPLLFGRAREIRREKRDEAKEVRREREELVGGKREQCIKLLGLARQFQVLVVSSTLERDEKVEQVRRSAAEIASQADIVEFNVPSAGAAAVELTIEAKKLAADTEQSGSPKSAALNRFDRLIDAFKETALVQLREHSD